VRKLTLSLAVMAALLPGRVLPLGLGEIELKSALNQELDATVEVLSVAPEEVEQLIVKLASREAFDRAGIDRSFALQDIKFKTEVKGDKAFIHITTADPVREPFLSFLVEVDWPNGHLLREYTLLLDPPVYTEGAPVLDEADQSFTEPADELAAEPAAEEALVDGAVADEAAATEELNVPETADTEIMPESQPALAEEQVAQADTAATAEVEAAPAVEAEASYQPMPQYTEVSGQYRVKQNDTLWSLASQMRPDSTVTVEQMMLALVHENPECFIKENIHGIKRGYILRMPNRDTILAVDRSTALAQVKEHTALWREYRQSLAAAAPASAMEAENMPADETAPADAGQGRLNIVGADREQAGEAAGSGRAADAEKLRQELAVVREVMESEKLQKENLITRLDELEQRVQHVLDMDDAELAKLQSDMAGTAKEVVDAAAAKSAAGTTEEPAVFADEQPAKPAKPKKPKPVAPPQPPAPSFVDTLLENLTSLPVLGGLLLVVLGGGAAMVIRRRKAKANEQQWADLNAAPLTADDFAESVGPVVVKSQAREPELDMAATAEMPMSAMEKTVVSKPDEAPAEEVRDDVIAESDVYLAYGIYQQAEDLLRNALSQHPERDDYRMKLLETYFASKNAGAFAELAQEAQARKGNVKSYWDRVVVMGRELCPGNAMFTGGGEAIAGLDADDLLPHKPATTDLELDAEIDLSPDLDLGLDLDEKPSAPQMDLDTESTMIMQQPVQAEEPVGLELDLAADLENIASAMEQQTAEPAATADMDMDLGDFSLELPEAEPAPAPAKAAAMDAGVDEDFSLDFEASDLGFEPSAEAGEPMTADLDASLDLGMDMEEAAGTDSGALEMDMSGMELDLEQPATRATSASSDSDDFDISQLSEDIDEVSTKLDLARAYMDMGDNEGAKNILEEVKAEGNAAQKKQAEELLQRAG